jgi:hypothetical protein
MRSRPLTRSLPTALLLLAAGCLVGPPPRQVKPTPQKMLVTDQFQIWSRDSAVLWKKVVITADSVSGVPVGGGWPQRRSLPLADVDSIVVHHSGASDAVALAVGAVFVGMLYLGIRCHHRNPSACEL